MGRPGAGLLYMNGYSTRGIAQRDLQRIASVTREPPRISQTRWFERKHDEVSEAKFKRESVGGRANCVACHRDAESGDFDEDRVKIPR